MQDILSTIIAEKREALKAQKRLISPQQMEEEALATLAAASQPRQSMRQSLAQSPTGIIAEFKRRSPSKGWIKQEADPTVIPPAYEKAGASALSILTNEPFFGGRLDDLRQARPLTALPILRKEFIIDPYQVDEATISGADAILLIAACLTLDEAHLLAAHAHRRGLEVLLEIHDANELKYIAIKPDMIGVNNRHLGSFVTDVNHSFQLAEQLPRALQHYLPDYAPNALKHPQTIQAPDALKHHFPGQAAESAPVLVSESGISKPETICQLRRTGFRGFLIGETFMKTPQPAETLSAMVSQILNSPAL